MLNIIFWIATVANVIVWGTLIVSFLYFTIRRKIAERRSKRLHAQYPDVEFSNVLNENVNNKNK